MVEYTVEEQILLDKCLLEFKIRVYPDRELDFADKKVIVAALDYCHIKGLFIVNPHDHVLMFSILDKNGVQIESPQARQARLMKERQETIAQLEIKRLEAKEAEAAEKVEEIKAAKEKVIEKVEEAKKVEEDISTREEAALKRAKEAEDEMTKMKAEIEALKAAAKLTEAAPEVVENEKEAVAVAIPEEAPPVKEKSIDELIDELNK